MSNINSDKKQIIGITNWIKDFLPDLYDFWAPSESQIQKVLKAFLIGEQKVLKAFKEKGEVLTIDNTIPIMLYQMKIAPNLRTKAMLDFVNEICKNLKNKLNDNQVNMVKKNIINEQFFNLEIENSRCKTGIGELAYLNHMISEDIELHSCEYKMQNGKGIDFIFIINGKKIGIEVYNIANFNSSKILSEEDLELFFDKRINQKLEDQLKNIDDIPKDYLFYLQPIVWGDIDQLINFYKFFEKYDMKYSEVRPLCYLGAYKESTNGNLVYVFERISKKLGKPKSIKKV